MARNFGFKAHHPHKKRMQYGRDPLGVRRKLIILSCVLAVICSVLGGTGYYIYRLLGKSEFFQVTAIDIEGCRRTSKKLVLELSGIDIHSNLLALKPEKAAHRIEENEWVKHTEIIKDWPNRLIIKVEERIPVAMLAAKDGLFYLDREGIPFTRVLPPEDLDYPVITGISNMKEIEPRQKEAFEDSLKFLRYASKGESILPKQNISEIHINKEGELTLYLVNRPFPITFGKGKIRTKYRRLTRVLYRLYKRKEFSKTAYITMDYSNDKVLVGFDTPREEKKQ